MNLWRAITASARVAKDYGYPAFKIHGLKGSFNVAVIFYSIWRMPLLVGAKPFSIQVEPTIRCNLRCKMCDLSVRNRKTPDLTLDGFKMIMGRFPFLQSVVLQGMGEPLLNPEFFSMVECATGKGIAVESFTNNTLMTEETAEKIVSSGLRKLSISLDGATKETYENIRNGASFDKVIHGIELILKAKDNNKHPQVSIHFVGTKSNIHELPELIQLAAELGVQSVKAEAVIDWGKEAIQAKLHDENLVLDSISIGDFNKYLALAVLKAKEKKIALEISPELTAIGSHITTRSGGATCGLPWLYCYITVDGYVTPCCVRPDPRMFNFGNIFEQNFEDIWNGRKYREFRARLKSGNPPSLCKGCSATSGRN